MTATIAPAKNWDEKEHPRAEDPLKKGQFTDKELSKPEIAPLEVERAPETVFTKKYGKDEIAERTAAFAHELALQVEALPADENWNKYLDTMSMFHRYSPSNQMLIQIQRPDATRVAGTKTWNKMGRSVSKGERGIRIMYPRQITTEKKDSSGAPKIDSDGNKETKTFTQYGVTSVFDVAQTHGDPLPVAFEELSEDPPEDFISNLEQSIRDAGFAVEYQEIAGAGQGWTDPVTKQVVIDSKLSPAQRARTLAHERGHIALGHLDRLDEYHTAKGGARGAMEVEAESFAYVVCRNAGMAPVGGGSATYVAGWAKTDPNLVWKSADAVSRAVKTVLGDPPFTPEEELDADASTMEQVAA